MAMTPEQRQERAKRYGQVVARAWQDEAFHRRLLADPAGALREHGIDVPAGREMRVVENTDEVFHLVLPASAEVAGLDPRGESITALPPAQQERAKGVEQVLARAWREEAFKQRLLADPRGVLEEQGIGVPAGKEVRAVENSDRVIHLVLPAKPTELTDEQLDEAAGGCCCATCGGGIHDYTDTCERIVVK
jgi:hypothetical protein